MVVGTSSTRILLILAIWALMKLQTLGVIYICLATFNNKKDSSSSKFPWSTKALGIGAMEGPGSVMKLFEGPSKVEDPRTPQPWIALLLRGRADFLCIRNPATSNRLRTKRNTFSNSAHSPQTLGKPTSSTPPTMHRKLRWSANGAITDHCNWSPTTTFWWRRSNQSACDIEEVYCTNLNVQ